MLVTGNGEAGTASTDAEGTSARLVGAWRLVSYEARQDDGTVDHPMGRDVAGLLVYTPDGHVSMQVMRPGRPRFASGDIGGGSPRELEAAASGYFAYAGTFEVDEAEGTVTHRVELSLVPNWVGAEQKRFVRMRDDELELVAAPTRINGREQAARLVWRRVRDGALRAAAKTDEATKDGDAR